MKSEIKINRIKAKNKANMALLSDILSPEVLHKRVPRLAEVAEARVEYRNMVNEIRQWGTISEKFGMLSNKNLNYVAQIDQSVWSAVLEVFAKHDEETGELIADGLLYKMDDRGQLVLNRDFFFALLEGPLKKYDMRGAKKLV